MSLAAGLATACGKKAPPRPPQFVIPESPEPLSVTPVRDGVKVAWPRPQSYLDGTALEDLGSFTVLRACGDGAPFVPIANIAVSDRDRFRRAKTFSFVDTTVPPPELPCHWRVVAVTEDDYRSAPAEGWLGAPAPGGETAAPAPDRTPGAVRPPGAPPRATAAIEGAPEEPLLPAPLVSPTPFPPAPW